MRTSIDIDDELSVKPQLHRAFARMVSCRLRSFRLAALLPFLWAAMLSLTPAARAQTYSLGTSSLVEGPSAGSDSVTLTVSPSMAAWTAAPNASWLQVASGSVAGTGSVNVIFTFSVNSGATRTGTITIGGQTLTVTQAGSAYTPASVVTALVSSGLSGPNGVAVDGAGNVYIADTDNNAIEEWSAATGALTTLISVGLSFPAGVAVDGAGSVYIADSSDNAIQKYSAATRRLTGLVLAGLNNPSGVAVDSSGYVYIADTNNNAIEEYSAATRQLTTLVSSGLSDPGGVAVDSSGNLYIADTFNNAVEEWTASTGALATLVPSGLAHPSGVAVDGSGNIYIADTGDNAIKEWMPATGIVMTLVASGLTEPSGVAVDGSGNIYIADVGDSVVSELPHAFINPAPVSEPGGAGSDALPAVVPVTASLTGPFAPASDQSWLTIGQISNGVVNFSFTTNTTPAARTAQITLLGRPIMITQGTSLPPSGLSYASSAPIYGLGVPITINTASSTGGAIASYSVLPPLPAGLSLDPTTGVISGTPTALATPAIYTITATNANGSTTVTLDIEVTAPFVLGASSLVEGPSAGSDSVILTVAPATGSWTTTANESWLQVAPGSVSGTGSAQVIFSFDANSGVTRTGTLTVGGQTLAVTQAGSSYVAVNAVTELAASMATSPTCIALDSVGNVYFADNHNEIQEWSVTTGTVSPLVTSGLNDPLGLAVDGAGNLYIADEGSNTIEKWTAATQTLTTLISSGLTQPTGVAVDSVGNLYIVETLANTIEMWTAATGTLVPLANTDLDGPQGVAVDAAGNVYIADTNGSVIKEWSPLTGAVTTHVLPGVRSPYAIAVDGSGNLYIADATSNAIKQYAASTGTVAALPSSNYEPQGVAVDGSGNLYTAGGGQGAYTEWIAELPRAFIAPSGVQESLAAGSDALPVVLPATVNLTGVFAPTSNTSWLTISEVDSGVVSFSFAAAPASTPRAGSLTVLGESIAVIQSPNFPLGATSLVEGPAAGSDSVLLNPSGNQWTAATNAPWLHLAPGSAGGTGSATIIFSFDANSGATRIGTLTIAGQTLTVTQAGSSYVAAGALTTLNLVPNQGAGGIAVDSGGNDVYVVDPIGNVVEQVAIRLGVSANVISSGLNEPVGVAVDSFGSIYIGDTAGGAIIEAEVDQSPVPLVSSGMLRPYAVAVDGSGTVYFSDIGDNSIKKWIPATGTLTTLVSSGLSFPSGLAVDALGNVYIADSGNNAIKVWSAATQTVSTLAMAGLNYPYGVAVDGCGNVYIADTGNNAIKEWVAATQTVVTVVSAGTEYPFSIAVDGSGNLYLDNEGNDSIQAMPRAFVDPTPKSEPGGAGSDVLPIVLPATENLQAYFAPTCDQNWLTVGAVDGGGVSFSFTANLTPAARTAHITVLGVEISVTQSPDPPLGLTYSSIAPIYGLGVPITIDTAGSTGGPVASYSVSPSLPAGLMLDPTTGIISGIPTALALPAVYTVTATNGSGLTTVALEIAVVARYALAATSLLEGPGAGTDSVILTVTPPTSIGTVVANDSWLHVMAGGGSGTAGAVVIFNFDANTGSTRTGTLTIAGQTFTVTQAGAACVPPAAPLILLYASLPHRLAVDSVGHLYVASTDTPEIDQYVPGAGALPPLGPSGLMGAVGVAVDRVGNVYVADSGHNAIKEYLVANGASITLPASGLNSPQGVAVDGFGNIYIADSGNNGIKEYNPAIGVMSTLVSTGLNTPQDVAVDAAGNVYIADSGNGAIKVYNPATGVVTTLVSSGLSDPAGLAVDASGNVYIADEGNNAIKKWIAATGAVVPLVATGLNGPQGVAVDAAGDVYIADTSTDALKELPRAYVDPTPRAEPAAAGLDALPVVLPATLNLVGALAPTCDPAAVAAENQGWLTIDAATNGVVFFDFRANPGLAARAGSITVLGVNVSVNQSGATVLVEEPAGTPLVPGYSVVNFTPVDAGGSSAVTFTIGNYGAATLRNIRAGISGELAANFSVTAAPPTTVAANASAALTVQYKPITSTGVSGGELGIGFSQATLEIDSSDPSQPAIYLGLNGQILAPPVANPVVAYEIGIDPLVIDVLANDSDPDGNTASLLVTAIGHPSYGRVAITGDGTTLTYTPNASFAAFAGSDAFTYTITDGRGATATGEVSISNPYYEFKGSYNGAVVAASSPSLGAAQGALTLSMTGYGSFTGSLYLAGVKYAFGGIFVSSPVASVSIPRNGAAPIMMTVTLDPSNAGSVSVALTAGALAYTAAVGVREQYNATTNPAPEAGYYTVKMPPPAAPAGVTATAAAMVKNGKIASIAVSSGGSGYLAAPRVVISGGGSGAAATATISNGAVTAITVTSPGHAYSSAVAVAIDPPSAGLPQGFGFGAMEVMESGAVTVVGKLPDGTPFSTSAYTLAGSNGAFAFYAPVYAAPGFAAGALTFESLAGSDCDGSLFWVRPPQSASTMFPGGFSTTVNFAGARYAAPVSEPALQFNAAGKAAIELSQGNLPAMLMNTIFVSTKNLVTVQSPAPDKLHLTITAKTGLLNGTFLANPSTLQTTAISGIIYQKANLGVGLFLGRSQAGGVLLTPQ